MSFQRQLQILSIFKNQAISTLVCNTFDKDLRLKNVQLVSET